MAEDIPPPAFDFLDEVPYQNHSPNPCVGQTPSSFPRDVEGDWSNLSLNDRLLRQLSSRGRHCTQFADPNPNPRVIQARKIKVEGCRRLCKLSSSPSATTVDEECAADGKSESVQEILDDLNSMFESLSMEKPKGSKPRTGLACSAIDPEDEYGSANSSLSCDEGTDCGALKGVGEFGRADKLEISDSSDCGEEHMVKQILVKEDAVSRELVNEVKDDLELEIIDIESDEEGLPEQGVSGKTEGPVLVGRAAKGHYLNRSEEAESELIGCGTNEDDGFRDQENGKTSKGVSLNLLEEGFDGDECKEESAPRILDFKDDHEDAEGEFRLEGMAYMRDRSYKLQGKIFRMLYPHQQVGLRWLWSLHCKRTGGILGDDMGLGKTMQVSAFLAGLFDSSLIKRALVVAPKTLLVHWTKELSIVGLKHKIRDYSGVNANIRQFELQRAFRDGGVLLTTYDIVRNNYKSIRGNYVALDEDEDEANIWDYVILDEGHIIKNPKTQRAQSLYEISSVHRIVISGTPIQNNLKELWALFNFCCPEVLGDKNEFKSRYEIPILRGNDKNASMRDKHIGSALAKDLRERIQPFFLRRLKSEVFLKEDGAHDTGLPRKTDIIVWLKLSSCQRQLYESFLKSELVHSSKEGSPLAAITILKKICDHPLLLTQKGAEGVLEGMKTTLNEEDKSLAEKMAMSLAYMTKDFDIQVDNDISCKISFMMPLLRNLIEEGHIVLIFSQTRKMLNLIQSSLIEVGFKFLRIDGTTKISERERIVKDFQEGTGASIFLLTSQVGGLGLTLTKADRVIVVDPAWNPSTDNQSVDRAYRIGQNRDVLVYRLMTSGTIEEKIYRMQVFKGGLFRTATEHKEQTRYFGKKDLEELFSLPPQGFDISLTQQQLQAEHDWQHTVDDVLRSHITFLEKQEIAGVSHHSLLFSKTAELSLELEKIDIDRNLKWQSGGRSVTGGTSSDYVVDGAQNAFNPKETKSTRVYLAPNSADVGGESPEDITGKIRRLTLTLNNKSLLSRLPDRGEKLRAQLSKLHAMLGSFKDAFPDKSPDERSSEVVPVDDLTDKINLLSV